MTHRNPEATMTLLLEAVKQSGQRAVIASGWAGLKGVALPETIFMVEEAPHRWLFPQMAAVVHHGGAGTTAAGFRAGVPSVIVPHFIDQFFWGQRAESLGVGPKPIPRKDLTADRLASAIDQMLNDRAMRAKAATLGEVIRMEDGLSNAIKVIENQHTKLRSEA
jgi:UDP:flavonoid glycosyltransferase YjiC (YdhE family)